MKKFFILLLLQIIVLSCNRTDYHNFPYWNQALTNEQRVDDLIKRMTLEEKISQLNYQAAAIDRLGIPAYNWWNECLHGVGRAGLATVFPQAIGLGASWDVDLMNKVATVISDEARAKNSEFLRLDKRGIYYGLTFWTPNINIFRDPRWGRGQETYGEDPYLTGNLAVSFVNGLQGNDPKYLKVVSTSKHFAVHSGPESSRHSINVNVSEIDLRETYLPAFEMTVKQAKVASVMCAYNRVRDEGCCGSNLLLKRILRDEWGFNGYVVTDCGALSDFYREGGHNLSRTPAEAAALGFKNGSDLNCGDTSPYLKEAVEKGLITEDDINISIKRLFLTRFRLGMFDNPDSVKYSQIPYSVVRSEADLDVALKASRESMVLLKNNGILPLNKKVKKIAVIGPAANDYKILLGNYHGTSDHLITPLQGIKDITSAGGTEVSWAPGCTVAENVPLLETIPSKFLMPLNGEGNGLNGSYFGSRELKGEPAVTRIDPQVDFFWYDKSPVTQKMADEFSVRWEGYIVPEISGNYSLGINACNAAKLFVEDSLYLDFDNGHEPGERYFSINLEAGKKYRIRAELFNYGNDPQVHLLWYAPGKDLEKEALDNARNAEVVILVMGLTPKLEGEEMPVRLKGFAGGDRSDIVLPESQENLVKKVAALGKPVVMVLVGGSAIAVNWEDQHIPAILASWYPGEFGGKAIAEALFGEINPSGKLPVTFYRSVEDLPAFENYNMANRTYKYFTGTPLYPFGHGLSYTTFGYSELKISKKEFAEPGDITVSVKVKNTGIREGAEVVQLYVSDKKASVTIPRITLEGFSRISLVPGETKEVSFTIHPEQLAIINESGDKIIEKGDFMIYVGGKQPPIKGAADAKTTQVISGMLKYIGADKTLGK
jgi:beta-glucosidase